MAEALPGLRPWEVLSVEQAMDQITFGGQWYREPLGSYTTGPPYLRHWNNDVSVCPLCALTSCELFQTFCYSTMLSLLIEGDKLDIKALFLE